MPINILMRSHLYREEDMLIKDAKRIPELKRLLENLGTLSEEEIDAAKLPLKWYKKTLKKMKKDFEKCQNPYVLMHKDERMKKLITRTKTVDPSGELLKFTAETGVYYLNKKEYEIRQGQMFWATDNCMIWGGMVITDIDVKIVDAFDFQMMCLRSEYAEHYQAEIESHYGGLTTAYAMGCGPQA